MNRTGVKEHIDGKRSSTTKDIALLHQPYITGAPFFIGPQPFLDTTIVEFRKRSIMIGPLYTSTVLSPKFRMKGGKTWY